MLYLTSYISASAVKVAISIIEREECEAMS